jgi:hypothetical protein
VPRLVGHRAASMTLGTSSSPPASSSSTLTFGFSARRPATTDPEEPEPHIIKSYRDFRRALRFCWFWRTRSMKAVMCSSSSNLAGSPTFSKAGSVKVYLFTITDLGINMFKVSRKHGKICLGIWWPNCHRVYSIYTYELYMYQILM